MHTEPATDDERKAVLQAAREDIPDLALNPGKLDEAVIAKISDPSLRLLERPVFVVFWPGAQERVDIVVLHPDGRLAVNEPSNFDPWGEHRRFPRADWRFAVNEDDTNLGYWEWVAHQLEGDDGLPAA